VTTGKEKNKLIRNSTEHAYGTPFVRAVLPHHSASATGSGTSGSAAPTGRPPVSGAKA
jgi:hypothetical protein